MKKIILGAFAILAFATYTSAQNPEKNTQGKQKIEHHEKAKAEGKKTGHHKATGAKHMKKKAEKKADTGSGK